MSRNINPSGYEDFAITTTGNTLLSFATVQGSSVPTTAKCFKGRLEGSSIRVRFDGTTPTAAIGELLDPGDDVLLDQSMIELLRVISVAGTANLRGHYYEVEAAVFLGG